MADSLEGIRILDCTQVMAGPFAALQLANLGAEVIKVESPKGDATRAWGPFVGEHSMPFLAVNRGKKSVVLDLKTPEGVDWFKELAKTADVLIENFRPGTMSRLGLDYQELKRLNLHLIYCSISGYGQTGPYAHRGGYDLIAQGFTGIMSVTGEPDRPPVKAGIPVTDLATALFATQGILAALLHREKTGEGQHVDTSLFDAGVALSVWEAHTYFATGETPRQLGSAHRLLAPYQALTTSDGYITVGAGPQHLWERFCQVLEHEELIGNSYYASSPDRLANRKQLEKDLEEITIRKSRAYWLERLEEAGIPAGPIYSYDEVFSDPHTLARELVVDVQADGIGPVKTLGSPIKMSSTPPRVGDGVPRLGEHTDQVLSMLRPPNEAKSGSSTTPEDK